MDEETTKIGWTIHQVLWVAFTCVAFLTYGSCKLLGEDPTQLTIGSARIEYCSADAELDLATIHVELTITNGGQRNLILSRQFGPIESLRVADKSGRTVYSPNITNYETELPKFGDIPDGSKFEVVRPGQTAERDFVTGLYFTKDPAHPVGSSPGPGKYLIWVKRSSWPVYGDLLRAKKMRKRWLKYGYLFLQTVKLNGVKVRIAPPSQILSCEEGPPKNGG